jgi:hypothetical protein
VHELTPKHRTAIEAAIPAGVVVVPEFWAELTEIITHYQLMRARRVLYDVGAARRRWRRLEKSVAALAPQLGEKLVREFKRRAEAYAAYHDMRRALRGTKDPRREFLYWGVLGVWTNRLGGKLKCSTAIDGAPTGPLVRFFVACVEPILGPKTPHAGIADIVDRERKRRRGRLRSGYTEILLNISEIKRLHALGIKLTPGQAREVVLEKFQKCRG